MTSRSVMQRLVGALLLVLATVIAAPAEAQSDFGDDSSQWAKDGECDDPRFEGQGSASTLLDEDRGHDATDCRKLFAAGRIVLRNAATDRGNATLDFGDDSSEWARDGECDDPRFEGEASARTLLDEDRGHDATDCQMLFETGRVALRGSDDAGIDFGDDESQWARDGECDDPRFEGDGSAETLVDADLYHDATDCRTLLRQGRISLRRDVKGSTGDDFVMTGGRQMGYQHLVIPRGRIGPYDVLFRR